MNKNIQCRINLGVGDHIYIKLFVETIKHNYDNIYITHASDALAYWFNNDPKRYEFNLSLGRLLFSDKPYTLVPNANFPFYPNERIVKELSNIPTKTDFNCLCAGNSLPIKDYVVITTKMRQFPKSSFEQIKNQLASSLKELSEKYTIVILGEREVERSREYEAEVNRDQIFGIYDYLISILGKNKILDLTIPALGITCSNMPQFQQDCLTMQQSRCIISFGIGGNYWLSAALAKKTINLRADNEWTTDLMIGYPDMYMTKDINQFCQFIGEI